MFKMKKTRILSFAIAVILLSSMFVLPTSAAETTNNLFLNPTFTVEEGAVSFWGMYGNDTVGRPTIENNLLVPGSAGYDATAPAEGNMFKLDTHGHGVSYSKRLELNSNGECYITVWYRANRNALRIVIDEYDEDNKKLTSKSVNDYLPNTDGKWRKHELAYKATSEGAEKLIVIFRAMDSNTDNLVADANIHFMAPSYSLHVPKKYLKNGDFSEGLLANGNINYWGIASANDKGSFEYITDTQSGNNYIQMTASNDDSAFQARLENSSNCRTDGTGAMPAGKYKLTFKYMPVSGSNCSPRVDIISYYYNTSTAKITQADEKSRKNLEKNAFVGGTPEAGRWTEYVTYFELKSDYALNDTTTVAEEYVRLRVWNNEKGTTIAYDDFQIEPVTTEMAFYQDGVTTDTLKNGEVTVKCVNATASPLKFIAGFYKTNGGVKTLEDIKVVEVPTVALAKDDMTIKFTKTLDENATYEVKAYTWSNISALSSVLDAKTIKTK